MGLDSSHTRLEYYCSPLFRSELGLADRFEAIQLRCLYTLVTCGARPNTRYSGPILRELLGELSMSTRRFIARVGYAYTL